MESATPDEALLKRIGNRDEAALRLLFTRHRLAVFRFLQRMVRNEAVAEELTNEVFLEVWRHAASFEGRSSVATWMLSIARNHALSFMRKRQDDALDDKQAATLPDPSDDPEIVAQKFDKAGTLRRCIDRLSPEHREIIDLAYYHEMSIDEVATIVGIPVATVKTRMFYARKKLAEFLKEAGIDREWP